VVWRRGHINKVEPRRARLVLGLVTTLGHPDISPGPLSLSSLRGEYWRWFRPPLG